MANLFMFTELQDSSETISNNNTDLDAEDPEKNHEAVQKALSGGSGSMKEFSLHEEFDGVSLEMEEQTIEMS